MKTRKIRIGIKLLWVFSFHHLIIYICILITLFTMKNFGTFLNQKLMRSFVSNSKKNEGNTFYFRMSLLMETYIYF